MFAVHRNTFCGEDAVNEANMREMAQALLTTGMANAGYDTINVVCNVSSGSYGCG
jgi:hypothetical protein